MASILHPDLRERCLVRKREEMHADALFQDTKPHRDIPLEHILDALEDDSVMMGSAVGSPPHVLGHGAGQNMAGGSDDTGTNDGQGCVFSMTSANGRSRSLTHVLKNESSPRRMSALG